MQTLTIFYDGTCPLCEIEINHLKKRNHAGVLCFEDIMAADFRHRFPELNWDELNERIHARYADGRLITGLDVTHAAWSAVGVKWLYAPLRWPLIKWFADKFYLVFARHRYRIAFWLTGRKPCRPDADGTCKR